MRFKLGMLVLCLAAATLPLRAQKAKKVKAAPKDPQDQIEVVGHVALDRAVVKRFLTTRHYDRSYLYVEYEAGTHVTLLDVTEPRSPLVLAQVPLPAGTGGDTLLTVAGTSALISEGPSSIQAQSKPQTIRVMDLSDPKNPKVTREFTGVTAIQKDEPRGLVFVAASDGLWIVHEHLATDPEVEKAYDDYVRYGMSMYPPRK